MARERTTYELSATILQVIGSTVARTSGLEDRSTRRTHVHPHTLTVRARK